MASRTELRRVAEYRGATWAGPPRAYGNGRQGYQVRLSVLHHTAGSESRASAEGGAAYDKRRTDGTSCHVFHDPDSSVQEVDRLDRSNSAFTEGNRIGIHHELCGTLQTREQWLDQASDAILWRAARAQAQDVIDFNLQVRRLSVAEVRACWTNNATAPGGLCDHWDITRAFPGPGRSHTDVGPWFPWDIYLERVKIAVAELRGGPLMPAPTGRKARHSMVLYMTKIKENGQDVNVWALGGASPGTRANWQEVRTQAEANGFSAHVGASAISVAPEKFAELKADFLSPVLTVAAAPTTGSA